MHVSYMFNKHIIYLVFCKIPPTGAYRYRLQFLIVRVVSEAQMRIGGQGLATSGFSPSAFVP